MPILEDLQALDPNTKSVDMVGQLKAIDNPAMKNGTAPVMESGDVLETLKAYATDPLRGALHAGQVLAKAPEVLGLADKDTPSFYNPADTRDVQFLESLPQHGADQSTIGKIGSGVMSVTPFIALGAIGGPAAAVGEGTIISTSGLDAYERAKKAGLSTPSAASHGILAGLSALFMLKFPAAGNTLTQTLTRAAIAGPGLAIGTPAAQKLMAEGEAAMAVDAGVDPSAYQTYADSITAKEIFDPANLGTAAALTFGFGLPSFMRANRQANSIVESVRVAKASGADVAEPENFSRLTTMAADIVKGRPQEKILSKVLAGEDISANALPGDRPTIKTDLSTDGLLNDLAKIDIAPPKVDELVGLEKKARAKKAPKAQGDEIPPKTGEITPKIGVPALETGEATLSPPTEKTIEPAANLSVEAKVEPPTKPAPEVHYQTPEGTSGPTAHDAPYNLEVSGPDGIGATAENVKRIIVDADTWQNDKMISRLREDVGRLTELYPKAKITIMDTRGDSPVEWKTFNSLGNKALYAIKKEFGATEDVQPRVARKNVSVQEKVARILTQDKGSLDVIAKENPELAKMLISDLGLKTRTVESTVAGKEAPAKVKLDPNTWYRGTKDGDIVIKQDRAALEKELPGASIEVGTLDSNYQFQPKETPSVMADSSQSAVKDLADILTSERGSFSWKDKEPGKVAPFYGKLPLLLSSGKLPEIFSVDHFLRVAEGQGLNAGVKDPKNVSEEVKYSGLLALPRDTKFTDKEMAAFLEKNAIKVSETQLNKGSWVELPNAPYFDTPREAIEWSREHYSEDIRTAQRIEPQQSLTGKWTLVSNLDTRHGSSYTVPGERTGTFELVLTAPELEYANPNDTTHYGDLAPLGWIRGDVRKDAKGNEILFASELQEGKNRFVQELPEQLRKQEAELERQYEVAYADGNSEATGQILIDLNNVREQLLASEKNLQPLKNSRIDLLAKRFISYAVEKGMKKIGWGSGEDIADIYNVRQVADTLELRNQDDHYLFLAKRGSVIVKETRIGTDDRAHLAEYVGPEWAKKLYAEPNIPHSTDVEFGGEFHKKLYGSIKEVDPLGIAAKEKAFKDFVNNTSTQQMKNPEFLTELDARYKEIQNLKVAAASMDKIQANLGTIGKFYKDYFKQWGVEPKVENLGKGNPRYTKEQIDYVKDFIERWDHDAFDLDGKNQDALIAEYENWLSKNPDVPNDSADEILPIMESQSLESAGNIWTVEIPSTVAKMIREEGLPFIGKRPDNLLGKLQDERGSFSWRKKVSDVTEVEQQQAIKETLRNKLIAVRAIANKEGKTLYDYLSEKGVDSAEINKLNRVLYEDKGFSPAQTGHILRKALGFSEQDYTTLKVEIAGVDSLKKMTPADQDRVLNVMQQLYLQTKGAEFEPISKARKNAYEKDLATAVMETGLQATVPWKAAKSFVDTFMSSAESVLKQTPSGSEFARLMRVHSKNAELRTGELEADFHRVAKGLSAEQINEAGAVYRGESSTENPHINAVAEFIGKSFKAYAEEMEMQGYKILNPLSGKREPFTMEMNPKRLSGELRKELEISRKTFNDFAREFTGVERTKDLTDEQYQAIVGRLKEIYQKRNGKDYEPKAYWPKEYKLEDIANPGLLRDRILNNIMKEYGISKAAAEIRLARITERMKKGPGLFGHLEIESLSDRQDFNKNVLEVLPEYWYRAALRLEYTSKFGQDNKGLDQWLEKIKAEGGDEKVAAATARRLFGGRDYVDPITRATINSVTTAETITKLGLAVLNNSTQTGNVYINTDLRTMAKTAKRVLDSIVNQQSREEMKDFVARTHVLQDTFYSTYSDFLRDPSTLVNWSRENVPFGEKLFTEASMAGNFLKYTGFTHVEAFNRLFSALAGREFAKDQVTALRNAEPGSRAERLAVLRLEKLGLDANELRTRELNDSDLYRAGSNLSDLTQFKNNALTLPKILGDSPWLRLLTLFHTFGYHQSKMLKDLWAKDPGRIVPSLVTIATTGGLVTVAKDFLRGKEHKWGESIWKDIASIIGNGIGFGMLMDAVENTLYSKAGLASFIMGPVVSDVGAALYNTGKAINGKPEALVRQGVQAIPVAGPTINNLTK